jgi:hypothetical protein
MSTTGPIHKHKIEQLRLISGNRGASIIGPRNPTREAENPSHRMMAQEPIRSSGSTVRITDSSGAQDPSGSG